MTATECPHGDDAATCPPCRRSAGKDRPLGHEPPAVEFTFTAKYRGDCPSCHLPVHIGQRAARLTNGSTVHKDCAS